MADFFQTYFVDPIYYNTGYNIVNTAAYALILIAAVFLTYKLLKKMKIQIGKNFFFGIIPFIALGGILRSWEDLIEAAGVTQNVFGGLLNNFILVDAFGVERNLLLVSPLIYVVMFLVALFALLVSKLAEKMTKIDYWKTWFAIGVILDVIVLPQLRFVSGFAFVSVVGLTAFWILAVLATKKFSLWKNVEKLKRLLTKENIFLIDIHLFEATTTFVALQFPQQLGTSYFEQHVVAGFLTSAFGPASFFLLKLIVVPIVLYYFDKEMKNSQKEIEQRTFLKIIVLILGLGPGLRNFLRLVMGV